MDDHVEESVKLSIDKDLLGISLVYNEDMENNTQVKQLLEKIHQLLDSNTDHWYSKQKYLRAQE